MANPFESRDLYKILKKLFIFLAVPGLSCGI